MQGGCGLPDRNVNWFGMALIHSPEKSGRLELGRGGFWDFTLRVAVVYKFVMSTTMIVHQESEV